MSLCTNCPFDWRCCKHAYVILTKEDEKTGLIRCDKHGFIETKPSSTECYAFNPETHKCTIYRDRPRACKTAVCSFLKKRNE